MPRHFVCVFVCLFFFGGGGIKKFLIDQRK